MQTAEQLAELPYSDLNDIFTTEVAGWSKEPFNKSFWRRPDGPNVHVSQLPSFITDPGEMVFRLSMHHCECRNNAGGGWRITIYQNDTAVACHVPFITFARAAVIALILAKRAENGRA